MKRVGLALAALYALCAACMVFDGLFYRVVYGELVWAFLGWLGVEW